MDEYKLYINGQFKDTSEKKTIINPANGESIAQVCVASKDDIDAAICAARLAFDKGQWPKLTLKERKNFLLRISQGILDKASELANLETLNNGKPIKESTFMDIPSSAKTFEYIANNFEQYLMDKSIDLENAYSRLLREPMGVVVLIVPWNYPLLIACWKLASALAAGNTVVLKPSSVTPLTVLELAKIIDDAGLPEGVVNIVNGNGSFIGEQLCSDKRVDLISFTGSNEVGKQILGFTCQNVKKTIMELGGKSASIVLKDADFETAVNGSLCSIFLNQGQMCTAMSRIIVEDAIYDKFVAQFVEKAVKIKLGQGLDFETQMGPLVSKSRQEKLVDFVEKARKDSAKILCGGKIPENPALSKGFFFEPTVIAEVDENSSIYQEEVFGPVVCISKFSGFQDAVSKANNSDFALACSIWTKDHKVAQEFADSINAGIFWVNTYGMFYNEVPFGGFKQSGFGKELGKEGFLEYTRLKTIIVDNTKDSKPLVNYWYGF
jgi:acyl-CoA reductase-like NAD-dependent aldehyde dehydrogenase